MTNQRRKKSALAIATVIVLLLAIIFYSSIQEDTPKESVRIGQLTAITGYGSASGIAEMEGAMLAISEANEQGGINGRHLELIIEDTQTDTKGTISAYHKLHDVDGINVFIGPTWSTFAHPLIPITKEDKTFLITPSASFDQAPTTSSLAFSTYHSSRWANEPVITDMNDKGYKRIAVVRDPNSFIQIMYDYFKADAQKNNIQIVADFEQSANSKDYKTIIEKIKEQKDVDAVYVLTSFWPNTGEFMKQQQMLEMDLPMYTLPEVENEEYLNNYGQYSENVMYMQISDTEQKTIFLKRFKERYGHTPTTSTAENAYDAANLIIKAMRSGAKTPEEIATHMRSIQNYDGVSARITFDEHGQVAYKEYHLKTIKEGIPSKYNRQ